jgi:hypothetical protein
MKVMCLLSMDCALVPDANGGAYIRENSALSGDAWYCELGMLDLAIDIAERHLESLVAILDQMASNDYERARVVILTALGNKARTKTQIMRRMQPKMHARQLGGILDSMILGGDIIREDAGTETYYRAAPKALPDLLGNLPGNVLSIEREKVQNPSGSDGAEPEKATSTLAAPDGVLLGDDED